MLALCCVWKCVCVLSGTQDEDGPIHLLSGSFYEQTRVIWPWVRSQPIKGNYATFYSGPQVSGVHDMQERRQDIRTALKMLQFHMWLTQTELKLAQPCRSSHLHKLRKDIVFRSLVKCSFFFFFFSDFVSMCEIQTRPDATFPNCPLRFPRATELNYYNGGWMGG